jgi:uncharacterized membrane protein (UPF0127 family)
MRNLILPFILCFASSAWAQQDPTEQSAIVPLGEPEALTIETGDAQHSFMVELAITPDQTQRGLMWRETLAPEAGMLFSYDPVRPASMWMENTLIPLDLLYILPDGRVAKIISHAQPGSRRGLDSEFSVAGVLEISAGRATELEIRPGAIVRHALFNNLIVADDTPLTDIPAPETANEDETGAD